MARYRLNLLGPLLLILTWIVVWHLNLVNRSLVPGFFATVGHLGLLLFSGDILPDLGQTLARMAIGYCIAAILGMGLGLLIGTWKSVYSVSELPLEFFRSLPVTTLYPLFILFFGIASTSKVAMVVAACVFVVTFNTARGVQQQQRVRTDMAKVFGATWSQALMKVTFWEALPQTLIGLRVALSYALIVEIVCEMFMGTQKGLGQRVFEAYNTYLIVELYAIVLLVGMTGYALNKLFALAERRLVHWVGA